MLNLTKTTHDDVELLSFIAHPLANMFPMIEGNAFEELKRDIACLLYTSPSPRDRG